MNATHAGVHFLRHRRRQAQRAPGLLGHWAREASEPAAMGLFYANLLLDPRVCQWLRNTQQINAHAAYDGQPGSAQLADLIAKYYSYYHDTSDSETRYADDDELAVGLAVLGRSAAAIREGTPLVPGAPGDFVRSAVGQDAIRAYALSPLEVDVLRRHGRGIRAQARVAKDGVAAHLVSLRRRYDRLVLPLHDAARMHWSILVVWRTADGSWDAWYLDSLGGDISSSDVALLHILLRQPVVPRVPLVPLQTNNVACGLHVLLATWEFLVAARPDRMRWNQLTTVRAEQVHAMLLTILMNCLSLLADEAALEHLGVLTPHVPHCPRVAPDFACRLEDTIRYPASTKTFLQDQVQRFQRYRRLRSRRSPPRPTRAAPVLDLT